ncbi:LD-carboxypeptidase [Ferrovum sp. PN-J185]|uniref:S66 peptidase family protein n=1 Tax=Ferrovum sp. PN-J185 TaxID=1356306 RepID=UPI0007957D23|nr:LD-carboxypeptidase [Ferrovum sp. PN-J185]KXW55784.1 murein tetrapeptide carboxypeptidase [Ferrovum sp. PN-J185]MCC6068518.1 LD-carboxypeptidase [Ferrovum sp. PN-J185]MDE1892169.1 LD-carboxypeptidase [Betaproteobacteria bacterium]
MNRRLPKRISTHATFGVCAPSGFIADLHRLDQAKDYLIKRGFSLIESSHTRGQSEYFSGTDTERLADLHSLVSDNKVQAIIAARGGYGLTRLLEHIDYELIAQSQKPIIGFSDVTALNLALLAKARYVSFQGPMLVPDMGHDNLSPYLESVFEPLLTSTHFISQRIPFLENKNALSDHEKTLNYLPRPLQGILWGGNLSILSHLTGTPYLPAIEGGILFIEEVNEEPYKIERMLMQLYHAGILQKQSALLLCQFNHCVATDRSATNYSLTQVIHYLRNKLSIPIIENFPFGHVRDKYTLPIGGLATLTCVDERHYTIELSQYSL